MTRPMRFAEAQQKLVKRRWLVTKGGVTIELNGVGATIWSLCDGRRDFEDIAEAISREYKVEPNEALSDCALFLERLQELGLVEVRD